MGVLTMNMSGYELEREDAETSRYDEEVLCAGWVPTLALREVLPERTTMSAELATMDVETFLRKMYRCQR